MIEQSYGRYIRKDFLGPLIAARPKGLRAAAAGGKTGPQRRYGKKARIYYRIVVEAGAIKRGQKALQIWSIFKGPSTTYPQNYPISVARFIICCVLHLHHLRWTPEFRPLAKVDRAP
jgi:hypothetical protein